MQAYRMLEELAQMGIYGREPADVAERFICERLRDMFKEGVLEP